MKKTGPLTVVVVFVVVSVVVTWMVAVTLNRAVPGQTHSLSAQFTDVSGLTSGDDVRIGGVRVGRVDSIHLDGSTAVVGFSVQDAETVFGDTKVAVTYQNLIGQRYLALTLGAPGAHVPLPPRSVIPESHTEPSFDISRLLRGFEPLFGTLDPSAVDNISNALIKALQGDNGSLAVLISQTTSLAQSLAAPDKVLGDVIENLATITGDLAGQSKNLTTVITQTQALFEGLNAKRSSLFGDIDGISKTVDRAAQIVQADRPDLTQFVNREPGFAQHIVDYKGKYGFLAYNLPYLLKGLSRVFQSGANIDAYICTAKITLVPGLAPLVPDILSAITAGGRQQFTSRCR